MTDEKKSEGWISLLASLGLAVIYLVWVAFVCAKLWHWYLMPMGLPDVSWQVAYIVLLLLKVMRGATTQKPPALTELIFAMVSHALFAALVLAIGAILR